MKKVEVSKKPIAFLIFVMALLFTVISVHIATLYVQHESVMVQQHDLEDQLERAYETKEALVAHQMYMETDAYIESLAREKLNLIMPGEVQLKPIAP